MKNKIVVYANMCLTVGLLVALLLFAATVVHASTVPQCKVYEMIVRTDSTYYQVECGGKVKIKSIVETD